MVRAHGAGFVCEGCGTFHPRREDAQACEERHHLISLWAEGKVDDLAVAQGLGLPTDTPQALASSMRSLRGMLRAGADASLSSDSIRGASMREAPPVFVNTTQIHSEGRTQIPASLRAAWGVKDGDFLFWYRQGDMIIVTPYQSFAPHRQPRFSYKGKEQPSPP